MHEIARTKSARGFTKSRSVCSIPRSRDRSSWTVAGHRRGRHIHAWRVRSGAGLVDGPESASRRDNLTAGLSRAHDGKTLCGVLADERTLVDSLVLRR